MDLDLKVIKRVNWSVQDRELLVNLAAEYQGIIESAETNKKSAVAKDSVWESISNRFNLRTTYGPSGSKTITRAIQTNEGGNQKEICT